MNNRHGQAVVEYLLIFVILAGISIGMFRGAFGTFSNVFTLLSVRLSQKLSTGICARDCLDDSYRNKVPAEGEG